MKHGIIRAPVALTLFLVSCLCMRAGAAPSTEEIAKRADAYLRARTDAGNFSGNVLLARGGAPLFVKSYGFSDETTRARNAVSTRFPIASITKPFTATLVMKLQQQGRLDIGKPICTYLDSCPAHWRPITVRHLLLHTSGIADYAKLPDFPRKMREPRTPAQLIGEFRELPLDFAPGARYGYSNSGYVLLGRILEKAGGRTYAQLLQEQIFTPLDMRDSGLDANIPAGAHVAIGYRPDGARNARVQDLHPSWLYAAGGIYSTVDDLLKWDRALSAGTVLPPEVLAQMWAPEHGVYGFGWQLMRPAPQSLNRTLVYHAGGTIGFATDFLKYPQEQVTVVVLANLLPIPLTEISRDLSAIVFGEAFEMPVVRKAVRVDPALYDEYAGVYGLAPNVDITVAREGDRLTVQATGQPMDIAIPESATMFFSRISPVRISFVRDAAGKVSRLVLHQPGGELSARRK
jgi:CubicO group peptidase (beta-lactamase class C family)